VPQRRQQARVRLRVPQLERLPAPQQEQPRQAPLQVPQQVRQQQKSGLRLTARQ